MILCKRLSCASGPGRFAFQIGDTLCLVQRCTSDQGRHSFVLGGLVGPNVFHDCVATRPYGSSEPHGSLIVGTLYDCVRAPLAFRVAKSAPPRWMGFNSFAWNCEGMFIVQKALAPDGTAAAQNYSIGHVGLNAMLYNRDLIDYDWPDGWIECVHSRVARLAYSHDILPIRALADLSTSTSSLEACSSGSSRSGSYSAAATAAASCEHARN